MTGWCATPASVGSIPTACSNHPECCSGPCGWTCRGRHTGLPNQATGFDSHCPLDRKYHLRSADRERSTTASRTTRPVSIATTKPGGRRAPAPGRAVVVRSMGNPGQAGRGRDDVAPRSASRIRTTPECARGHLDRGDASGHADFARAWSFSLRAAAAKARRTATAAGVATHRYLGPKLSRSSGRLLNGWALVRIQPVPRRTPPQPQGLYEPLPVFTRCSSAGEHLPWEQGVGGANPLTWTD